LLRSEQVGETIAQGFPLDRVNDLYVGTPPEKHGGLFSEDGAPGSLDVGAHAGRIDGEPIDCVRDRGQRAAGRLYDAGDGGPLGLPPAGGAFVLLGHRAR
jgi:hypothetical protein